MSGPTPGEVHVNTPLTNISINYLQNATSFIAGRVFPVVPVMKQSDRYYTYDRGYFNRDEMEVRGPGAESAGTGYSVDNTPTYYCPVRALHHDIADDVRANADPAVDPDLDATNLLTQKGLINREVNFVTSFFSASVWTNDYDGVAGTPGTGEYKQWDDADSSPIEDIRGAGTTVQESTGFRPNKLVIGRQVFDALVDHPDLVDRVKYSGGVGNNTPAMVNMRAMAELFEVDEVLVASAIKNTGKEGATNSHSFIAGKKALLVYAAPSPGLQVPTGGYTFAWTNRVGGSAAAQGFTMSKFRRSPEFKSDRVEIESSYDQKLVSADLGAFWDSIVA